MWRHSLRACNILVWTTEIARASTLLNLLFVQLYQFIPIIIILKSIPEFRIGVLAGLASIQLGFNVHIQSKLL